jgi:hypothetical protein
VSYKAMRDRCLNPHSISYPRYGAAGVTICQRWLDSYEDFVADVGERPSLAHSLDRIDVKGNYEPGNVRWATASEQQRNRRDSNLVVLASGENLSLYEAASRHGLEPSTLYHRIIRGLPESKLFLPARPREKLNADARREIIARRLAGERPGVLAREFKVSEDSIRGLMRKAKQLNRADLGWTPGGK